MLHLYDSLWGELSDFGMDTNSVQHFFQATKNKLVDPIQGDYPRWLNAYESLPDVDDVTVTKGLDAITCSTENQVFDSSLIKQCYQGLIPWRKGPFNLFSTYIDSEWQSNFKWNRIVENLPVLNKKKVLDVGCGNGYYLLKMAEQTPHLLMGVDPGLLQVMQFWSVEKYLKSKAYVLPLSLEEVPKKVNFFDVVFSMGVLYHRRSPIDHIKALYDCMSPNGFLVIETLVVKGDQQTCLIPTSRYAQMRNVWFLPSVAMLQIMLQRSGFKNIDCVDVSYTTIDEQRTTDWMRFHSLKEFLNDDQSKTIEGYDLPLRATLVAQKS